MADRDTNAGSAQPGTAAPVRTEGVPLSTAYNLTPMTMGQQQQQPKTFMDVHGKVVLVAIAALVAALVTFALIIDILIGTPAVMPNGVVVSELPFCSNLGADWIRRGASVADGAIVTSLCLSVIMPHKSGLGGGGFMLAKQGSNIKSYDFMAAAPADVSYYAGQQDGKDSVLVPGYLRGLEALHADFGQFKWAELVQSAADIAKDGFGVSQSLAEAIAEVPDDRMTDTFRQMFAQSDGTKLTSGEEAVNVPLSELLTKIATSGPVHFYSSANNALLSDIGNIKAEDLINYAVNLQAPSQTSIGGSTIYSNAEPSGGPALLSTLNIMAHSPSSRERGAQQLHYLLESLKFSSAQQLYAGDADTAVLNAMLNQSLASIIEGEIRPEETLDAARIKNLALPQSLTAGVQPADASSLAEVASTVVAMDDMANVVVISTSLYSTLGSGVLSEDGYFYNNFAAAFSQAGSSNEMSAGARPVTNLAPMIAFDPDNLCALHVASGSEGTGTVASLAHTALAVILRGVGVRTAVSEPRVNADVAPLLEQCEDSVEGAWNTLLKDWGHDPLQEVAAIGRVAMASKVNDDVTGVNDPRIHGSVSFGVEPL